MVLSKRRQLFSGVKLGRPLLAFVHVNTKLWAKDHQLLRLAELPDVEEMHTITGESAMLLKGPHPRCAVTGGVVGAHLSNRGH
jgi:hypothetical protein